MRAVGKNPNATPIREQSSTTAANFVLISTLGIIGAGHLKISWAYHKSSIKLPL